MRDELQSFAITLIKIDMKALILFGHGARDSRWREPFDRLVNLWKERYPDVRVGLAFLELMQPTLEEEIISLVDVGAKSIVVVPVFFGQGGHLRNDFPILLEACQKKFPTITLSATAAVGEDEGVLQAIVDFSARSV
jgi:sirohydrochlorin cobaltochelatase